MQNTTTFPMLHPHCHMDVLQGHPKGAPVSLRVHGTMLTPKRALVSRARSSADPVAGSAGTDPMAGSAGAESMAGSAAASVGLGVGVWLATSSACVG